MTAWQGVEQAAPEFAQRVRALFDAHKHKTIATLRADGSPRISGIEAVFEDGELVVGSMPNARKGADLRRDPRFALHSATVDPVEGSEAQWPGEAKISGRAIAAGPPSSRPTPWPGSCWPARRPDWRMRRSAATSGIWNRPNTANPHLIINQMSAVKTSPVSTFSFRKTLRSQPATLERLRVDRQLEEALTHGPDPLHLAAVFGLDDKTAIRYANAARQILESPTEQHDSSGTLAGTPPTPPSHQPRDDDLHRDRRR
jgi:hypothetical protein